MSYRSRLASLMRPAALLLALALLLGVLAQPGPASSEGSGTLFPPVADRFRANLEWRNARYGFSPASPQFNLFRRTLLKLYVNAGEQILLGSSAINVPPDPGPTPPATGPAPNPAFANANNGDIRVYVPGAVTGLLGQELVPPLAGVPANGVHTNGFSCAAQGAAAGNASLGRIGSRAAEEAGPNTANNLLPAGYTPCVYTAPVSGIYDVAFVGPAGDDTNFEPIISGALNATARDLSAAQASTTSLWDVSVRTDLNALPVETGRLFLYYFSGITGGNGRNTIGTGYVVTDFGFQYRVRYGADPFGFLLFANDLGFRNSDGNPLYHNLLADPNAPTQGQNELREIQGGAQLLPPRYPIFFNPPNGPALDALGLPRAPNLPQINSLSFTPTGGGTVAPVGQGGTFRFQTSQPGVRTIVISRDGIDFDPENPQNRFLLGIASVAGPIEVVWDGRDNAGLDFPEGTYQVRTQVQGGEIHFPFLDVENNLPGTPTIELINPPDRDGDGAADCPPWAGGCFGAFYDDGGYRTANGTLVGTAVNGPLCVGNAANPRGFGNPPQIIRSGLTGFDTRTPQRSFGFASGGNPGSICLVNGGFGDKKGLDLWTFYPSNLLQIQLQIGVPSAVTLTEFSAARGADGVAVRWATGAELGTAGFHILRSTSPDPATAARVTARPIPARGGAGTGASYSWTDTSAAVGPSYYYWLEELTTSGSSERYGPTVARPATSDLPLKTWVPLVGR